MRSSKLSTVLKLEKTTTNSPLSKFFPALFLHSGPSHFFISSLSFLSFTFFSSHIPFSSFYFSFLSYLSVIPPRCLLTTLTTLLVLVICASGVRPGPLNCTSTWIKTDSCSSCRSSWTVSWMIPCVDKCILYTDLSSCPGKRQGGHRRSAARVL